MLKKTCKTHLTAFELFVSLRGHEHPFILDSGMNEGGLGRYSFVGADPFLTFTSKGEVCRVKDKNKTERVKKGDPFELLGKLLKQYPLQDDTDMPFTGGAVGYLGYDMCHFIENIPRRAVDDVQIPDCFFGFYDGIYMVDHQRGVVEMVALGIDGDEKEKIAAMEAHLLTAEKVSLAPFCNSKPVSFQANMSKETYLAAIGRIKEYIRSGDIYQVNFTQRFSCEFKGDAISFYAALRAINPAPFSAYIDTGQCIVVSSSPERFIKVEKGKMETRPIKGTISRGETPEEDAANRQALLESEKDRAELLMIVDLERNDFSRVAKTLSVKVPDLFRVETYATVHHLVATVTADLRPECDLMDCIRATFPGGSITGAPKIRAMEIIDELEPTQRNVYTGAIGYLGFNGNMDLNIVIRTVVIKDGQAYFQAGGGIVWNSDPEKEYEESLVKAKALMEALQL